MMGKGGLRIKAAASALTMIVLGLVLNGCKTVTSKSMDSFTVYHVFSLKEKSGKVFDFVPGDVFRSNTSWNLLVVEKGNQTGLVLERVLAGQPNLDFPLQVPKDFALGYGSVPASQTGQSVGITQQTSNVQFVNDPPVQETQPCEITHTRTVCNDSTGKCHTITITDSGQQTVTVQREGYTQEVIVNLVDAQGNKLASVSAFDDETYQNSTPGVCTL